MADGSDGAFPLRACLIVDEGPLRAWQVSALELAIEQGLIEIVGILACRNTHTQKDLVRHFGYYAIRTLMMRPAAAAGRDLAPLLAPGTPTVSFDSEWEGAWQRIPAAVQNRAAGMDCDVAIKFGMNLLRDPDGFPARLGMLSFHHGDPSKFRGRPAGFYELLTGAGAVGAMVQRLSNRLDAGRAYAFGAFKIHPHSYKATLQSLYWGSRRLLPLALRNLAAGRPVKLSRKGRNYRLPGNLTVAGFLAHLMARKVSRLTYGALWEKRWRLYEAPPAESLEGEVSLNTSDPLPLPAGYRFLADGFRDGGDVLCEGLDRRTGQGVALRLSSGREPDRLPTPGHVSYPHPIAAAGQTWVVPEVAAWSAPFAVRVCGGRWAERRPLKGLETTRVLDPTPFFANGSHWLFGTLADAGLDQLWLWRAPAFDGPYSPHPRNPVVIDPARARPAGPVRALDGRLIRPGQDNSGAYGGAVALCAIEVLTETEYKERVVGQVRAGDGLSGPHTLDLSGHAVLFDAYEDVLNPLAGWNRVKAALRDRRSARLQA